jgi:hypothetical protein
MTKSLDELTIEAGNIIHYNGMPFILSSPAVVLGRKGNMELAKAMNQVSDEGPSRG